MAKDTNKLLFDFNGFQVYENSRIILGRKRDEDAPSGGLQKLGTTKFPGASESATAPFVHNGYDLNQGQYDLGFEDTSIFYRYLESDERETSLKNAVNNVLKPYAKFKGKTPTELTKSEEYYNEFRFSFKEGDTLNAYNEEDRFKLWILIITGKICPIDKQHSSEYRHSCFTAYDTMVKKKASETLSSEQWKVTTGASKLLSEGRIQDLLDILHYIGVRPPLTDESDEVQFIDYIETSIKPSNTYRPAFIEAVNKETKEIKIFTALTNQLKKSSSNFEKVNNKIIYTGKEDDFELGSSIKQIAEKLSTSDVEEYKNIVKELLLG